MDWVHIVLDVAASPGAAGQPRQRAAIGQVGGVPVAPAAAALALALVHVVAKRCHVVGMATRLRFLSFAGGVSVAYVFVHILPEISEARRAMSERPLPIPVVEEQVYVVAMAGFVTYYGLEAFVNRSADETETDRPTSNVFWVHVGSFAAYNGIIGYLLFHRETPGLEDLALFAVALSLHFLVNDFGLQSEHADAYLHRGRWVLAGAVLVGGAVGAVTEISRTSLGLLFAFVGGGVVLNVIKEELPTENRSSFPSFAAGVVVYSLILSAA